MERSISKNLLNGIPFILHRLINHIIFPNTECCLHSLERYHIFNIFDILIDFIIHSGWFQHDNPASIQKSWGEFLCRMIKIDRCKKAKMLRKLKAFGSAKRNRTVRHRCEVTVSKERCPIMLYRAEICFVEKDNKGSNSGLVTIIFAIHSLECIKYFPVTAFHLFRQRIIVSNKVLVGRPPSFDRDIDKTPLRNICY